MEKIHGFTGFTEGLYKIGRNKYELAYRSPEESADAYYIYRQRFGHLPTPEECRAVIKDQINADTDLKILSGFTWKEMPVWLSSENQFNYKAAYDLAVQSNGATLPVTFKFGTDDAPVYHTFATLDEFTSFYTAALRHISDTLAAGWREKDKVDGMTFETDE